MKKYNFLGQFSNFPYLFLLSPSFPMLFHFSLPLFLTLALWPRFFPSVIRLLTSADARALIFAGVCLLFLSFFYLFSLHPFSLAYFPALFRLFFYVLSFSLTTLRRVQCLVLANLLRFLWLSVVLFSQYTVLFLFFSDIFFLNPHVPLSEVQYTIFAVGFQIVHNLFILENYFCYLFMEIVLCVYFSFFR